VNTPRPKVRRSRALGIPLTPKCVRYFERRPYPPGEHGRKRRKASDYSTRLLEKQRLRAQYDISETQLRRAFDRANQLPAPGTAGQQSGLLQVPREQLVVALALGLAQVDAEDRAPPAAVW